MDFIGHGALVGGVAGSLCRLLKLSPKWVWWALGVSFALGTIPDSLDFIYWLFGGPRWKIYHWFHIQNPLELLWCPPIALHVWVDSYFHDPLKPGWNWWPEMWWLETGLWLVAIALLLYVLLYRRGSRRSSGE